MKRKQNLTTTQTEWKGIKLLLERIAISRHPTKDLWAILSSHVNLFIIHSPPLFISSSAYTFTGQNTNKRRYFPKNLVLVWCIWKKRRRYTLWMHHKICYVSDLSLFSLFWNAPGETFGTKHNKNTYGRSLYSPPFLSLFDMWVNSPNTREKGARTFGHWYSFKIQ